MGIPSVTFYFVVPIVHFDHKYKNKNLDRKIEILLNRNFISNSIFTNVYFNHTVSIHYTFLNIFFSLNNIQL